MTPQGGRMLGAAVGFVIGVGLSAVLATYDAAFGSGAAVGTIGWPMILSGGFGGWLIGPRAVRARTQRDWVGAIWRLAFVAVLIGDLVVCAQIAFDGARSTGEGPVIDLLESLSAMALLAVLGLIVVGWFAVIATSIAAAIWAGCMRLVRGPVPQVSGSGIHSPSATPSATNSG